MLDAFVSIIIFLSFVLSLRNKGVFVFFFTFIALLTKETSMLIPFAVAVTLFFLNNKGLLKYIVFASLVIFAWFVYKSFIGLDISAGLYSGEMPLWKIYCVNILKGFLIWPSGIPEGNAVLSGSIVYLSLILVFHLVLMVSLYLDGYKEFKNGNNNFINLLFWIIASIILLIFFGLGGRFGYTLHLFLVPVIFYLLINGKSLIRRIFYFLFCVWIVVSGIFFFSDILSSKKIESYKNKMHCAGQLTELLKEKTNNTEVILINDFTSSFGTPFLSDLAGSKSKIIKINSFVNYTYNELDKNITSEILINKYCDTTIIQVKIPEYTDFLFEGIKPALFAHNAGSFFKRNNFIDICFPDEELSGISKLSGVSKYRFGKMMIIRITGKSLPIIYFNPASGKYEIIN